MSPVRFSLAHPQVTLVLTAMLCAVGIHALSTMPRREDPKITIRTGLVAAFYPGATAEEVEKQVTEKIEKQLFRYEEVRRRKTYSTSRAGIVIVNVELEEWVSEPDGFWSKLRHDLNTLKATDLPTGVRGPIVNSDFGDTVAILLAVDGEHYGYRELKEYLDRIEDELRTIRAVSKIKRYGDQKEEVVLTSTLEKLSQYGVTPLRVIQALRERNLIEFGGYFDTEHSQVLLRPTGLFQTEEQIRRLMIDVSKTGQPVYLGDLADVERRYQDPDFLTRINGNPSVMLSVEMQEGYNIVEFGEEIRNKLNTARAFLPPDLEWTIIADQPKVVDNRVSRFIKEFGVAITAVILATMILLPFRVATIAACAIPVTVAITFGILNAIGVELHQVSIAALIVVLGMVVDDAVVIADNYVDLLDRGVPRPEAALRCSSELAVPVLTATLTIIASFLPLLLLTGAVGEFISSIPITVAVALSSSYVVAMLLTPLLCQFFVKSGLHQNSGAKRGKFASFRPLDWMQTVYDKGIGLAMSHKAMTVGGAVIVFAGGMVLLQMLPSRFFPSAERNQFVMDVWLPEGARLEATGEVIARIEEELSKTPEIVDFASFVGQSAPRFYYNVDPQPPTANYGQILVNSASEEQTPPLVYQLRKKLAWLCPEARVIVKELQQGSVRTGPIAVRIVGRDLSELKRIGADVEGILRRHPGSAFVRNDFREDSFQVKVAIRDEVANRLGFTNGSVARQLAGSFQGAPVSTFWEGDRDVSIVLRLDESRRQSFDNVRNAYLTSLVTGTKVPLKEIADLKPDWQTSRIVRRNGVRTLTVESYLTEGAFASQVLESVRPEIEALALPAGYRIEYGGDIEAQEETFAEMKSALLASLLGIYLILLFEFRSALQPLVVMISIPLAMVGAAVGLMLTSNPFGFTAYMGLISLSGVVVRNAIILVDYIHERRAVGTDLEEAALEAGRRRLRPIFLTSVAAAVGVTPMVLSGSSLWSPLASVIAVGLLCSMVFTLIVVPVIYVLTERRKTARAVG